MKRTEKDWAFARDTLYATLAYLKQERPKSGLLPETEEEASLLMRIYRIEKDDDTRTLETSQGTITWGFPGEYVFCVEKPGKGPTFCLDPIVAIRKLLEEPAPATPKKSRHKAA